MAVTIPNLSFPIPKETAPMAADKAKADSVDRRSRSLLKDLPVGAPKPAYAK